MKKTYRIIKLATGDINAPVSKPENRETMFAYKKASMVGSRHYHLYIISDDEIKEGDWVFDGDEVWRCDDYKEEFKSPYSDEFKKIIATTYPKLRKIIAGGGESNAEISRFLPQIPQSLIEYYAKHQPEEVKLEYDEITRKDALVKLYSLKLKNNEVVWVERGCFVPEDVNYNPVTHDLDKPKTYTREEVEELLMKALTHGRYNMTNDVKHHLSSSREWLKENL
jgi:hypothetical protein